MAAQHLGRITGPLVSRSFSVKCIFEKMQSPFSLPKPSRMMRPITRARFNVVAGYARHPNVARLAREIGWFEIDSPHLVGVVIVDTDGEFSGVVFAADLDERYRWVDQTRFCETRADAESQLEQHLAAAARDYARIRVQGDESGAMDFFTPIGVESRLHPTFSVLAGQAGYVAARRIVDLMMRWYRDQDGNFIEQFQTAGFDARIWELYLFATLIEAGYVIEQPNPAPDFRAIGLDGTFCVEATTINPSQDGSPTPRPTPEDSQKDVDAYLQHYLPIRFAGPLTAKLRKRYWEHADAAGLPLLFAIQDFHDELSMTYSATALSVYLYGKVVDTTPGDGNSSVTVRSITQHSWGTKKIDSGFFFQQDAENVSAVLFNPAGTLTKFNRIGVATGFGASAVTLVHKGFRYVGDPPERVRFSTEVTEGHRERWIDGMNVFHNPRASHPLKPEMLPGAAHHYFVDGKFGSLVPADHLVSSTTLTLVSRT